MATMQAIEKKTTVQKLPDLVEWYLLDKKVELRFVPQKLHRGKIAPEFEFQYWIDGRRITERGLAMCIATDLNAKDYNYNLAKIICALTSLSWQNYVATQKYPEWFRDESVKVHRKPKGRPRTHPKVLEFDEYVPQIEKVAE